MINLPFPPRRSHLRGFWVTLTVGALIAFGLLAVAAGYPQAFLPGSILFAFLLISGLVWKPLPTLCYRLWNAAAWRLARLVQLYLAALIHFLILTATGRFESTLSLKPPDGSTWHPYRGGSNSLEKHPAGVKGRPGRFIREAALPGRAWWFALLPLLILLSFFQTESMRKEELPENIYTLF